MNTSSYQGAWLRARVAGIRDGRAHRFGVGRRIWCASDDGLSVDEALLYGAAGIFELGEVGFRTRKAGVLPLSKDRGAAQFAPEKLPCMLSVKVARQFEA